MRSIVIFLNFIGILAVVVGYVNQLKKCPPPTVEYRYVPRTFQQDQDNPVKVSELYYTMFTEPTPWIRDMASTSKNQEINRYYISQL
jgi:hypothetical protein